MISHTPLWGRTTQYFFLQYIVRDEIPRQDSRLLNFLGVAPYAVQEESTSSLTKIRSLKQICQHNLLLIQ